MLRLKQLAAPAALCVIAFSAPVMAQETIEQQIPPPGSETPADAPPSDPAAEPAPAEPAPAEPAPAEAAPSGPTPPTSREEQVEQVVEAEFPSYDADQSGALDKDEFAKWVSSLRQKSLEAQGRPPVPENEMAEWTKNAFAKADSDKSDNVSKTELKSFLMG
ncbi:MAG: EF-hand domain-containing protein [Sphingomonadales bacterium]|nr:EF-hand domain-containing protein [Sphingomonadales bacterium]